MAEIKTGIFAKNVQKRLNRAQEKVLQKLGKADETKDEQFEQVVQNFKRQESEGGRLQREMKAYMSAIKGMQQASINLTQSLHEVYEPDWHGKDDIVTIGKDCDALWEDFHNKLVDSTLLNLDAYLLQFPDLKMRVAKRSRKLIDYDSARHHLETLQAAGMKNDRKMIKAEEELKKAQKVFDELDVGLQDELPTLWDCRVDFYISTFKSVTSLEAKFHREISQVCKELYEVMTKLREQHSDKIFTIQGAPSDSGPLRLARTPSPPEDESPPESPEAGSNHMLRPVSPGPPRPKSPIQLKKGPPVPPPPKVTPTNEVAEEQIIDLFGGEFLPAPSPSLPNERPGESLLDLDFDAFQPDDSVSPIPQTAVPWDVWSEDAQTAQHAADAGFVADWSADFGSLATNGDAVATQGAPAEGLDGELGSPQVEAQGWQPGGDKTTSTQSSYPKAVEDEVSRWESSVNSPGTEKDETHQVDADSNRMGQENRRKSTPGLIFTNEFGEEFEESTGDRGEKWSRYLDGSGSEYETAEEWGDGGQGWMSAEDELSYRDQDSVTPSEEEGHISAGLPQTKTISPEDDDLEEDLRPGSNLTPVIRRLYDPSGQDGEQHLSARTEMLSCKLNSDPLPGPGSESDPFAGSQRGPGSESDPFAGSQRGPGSESDPFAGSQRGPGSESDPFAGSQRGPGSESDLFAGSQRGPGSESDPFAGSQRGPASESDPFAGSQRGPGSELDPFAGSQRGPGSESDPFAGSQRGPGSESDPFAGSQRGPGSELDPFAGSQRGPGSESDPFAGSQRGPGSELDPFAGSQRGPGSESDPFAGSQRGPGSESDPFAGSQRGPGSELDPFAGSQRGPGSESDPFAGSQRGPGSELDPFAGSQGLDFFQSDPFAAASGDGGVFSGSGTSGWDSDPFANCYSEASSGSQSCNTPFLDLKDTSILSSSATQTKGDMAPEEIKDMSKILREPEHSDMSEDEAANWRFAKLYKELETEKEEDASAPLFFADFGQMKKDKSETTEAPITSETQAADGEDPPSPSPAAEDEWSCPPAAAAAEAVVTPSVDGEVTGTLATPAGEKEEEQAPSAEEHKASDELQDQTPAPTNGSPCSEEPQTAEIARADETSSTEATSLEKMPIPSVVIEPASSNEGEHASITHMCASGGASGLPADFLYKVETMHDFEAANSDELDLKRGDVVLVVPTASLEDQDAGWLTGIKEREWITRGSGAQRGLFPENFIQRLE